jgi:glucose repression regulatory protein TUP1
MECFYEEEEKKERKKLKEITAKAKAKATETWANSLYLIVSAQVSEMQLVREKVYAMEQTHMTLKQK